MKYYRNFVKPYIIWSAIIILIPLFMIFIYAFTHQSLPLPYYATLCPTKNTSPDLADFSAIPRPPTRALRLFPALRPAHYDAVRRMRATYARINKRRKRAGADVKEA